MTSSGSINLCLRRQGGQVVAADVVARRPQAAMLLKGKTPEQAAQLVPMLFSLCGGAQGVAAKAALQAAQGQPMTAEELADWANTVRRETALEHLWRLMLDWPQLCGLSRREIEFAQCRRTCMQAKTNSEFEHALQAAIMPELLEGNVWHGWDRYPSALGAKLVRCLREAGLPQLPPTACLPSASAGEWARMQQEISSPQFCARPSHQGIPKESGVLARLAGHAMVSPLLTAGRNIEARLVARLVELAGLAGGNTGEPQDWVDAATCGDGVGLARVETARGMLIHRAVVENGTVAEYAIVAPTEWNFHPQGTFAREAKSLAAPDDAGLLQQAQMLALSLDPCVTYKVVLEHA